MRLHKHNMAPGLLTGIAVVALCAAPVIASAGPILPHYGWQFRGGEWGNAQGNSDNTGNGGDENDQGDKGDDGGNGANGGDGDGGWQPGDGDQGEGGSYDGGNGDGDGGSTGPCDPPPPPVPEPATWALALAGLAGLLVVARQRRLAAAGVARKIKG